MYLRIELTLLMGTRLVSRIITIIGINFSYIPPPTRVGRWTLATCGKAGAKGAGHCIEQNNSQCISANNTICRVIVFMNMYVYFIIMIVIVVRRRDGENRYWTLLDSSGRKVRGDRFCLLLLLFFCSPFSLVSVCSPTHPGRYVMFEKNTSAYLYTVVP